MENPNPDPTAENDQHLALRRIQRISLHLASPRTPLPHGTDPDQLAMLTCARAKKLNVSPSVLSNYMRGKNREIQERVFGFFESRPDLQTPIEISKDEHRELCMRQLLALVSEAGIRPFKYSLEDPAKYFAIMEAAGSVDMSLGVKLGVQYR